MSSTFCGLKPRVVRHKKPRQVHEHANSLLNFAAEHALTPTTTNFFTTTARRSSEDSRFDPNDDYSDKSKTIHQWARDDQLSVILEVLDAETRRTPGSECDEQNWSRLPPPRHPNRFSGKGNSLQEVKECPGEEGPQKEKQKELAVVTTKKPTKEVSPARVQELETEEAYKEYIVGAPPGQRLALTRRRGQSLVLQTPGSSRDLKGAPTSPPASKKKKTMATERGESSRLGRTEFRGDGVRMDNARSRGSSVTSAHSPSTPQSTKKLAPLSPRPPRSIETPPRDLESIARIDASLVFEHFTTTDAWDLGCALRTRLLPLTSPVVIDISLANQNQTLFHTCTHSGVMPDNDSWVARKRRTVLRWGVSTWYMSCKFGGDERAFAERYGLGEKGGEYAIHGGGVPIRVRGVEGVVAVVVVSGLKQDEDHGVIVECIRELYY